MIVTKTPLRISFFGGGSDIPQFYNEHGGMVISTTIDKNIYLAVNKCINTHIRVIYSELEQETDVNNIKHDRVRETLKYFNHLTNIEICSFSDVPTKGTGLGSSSTFTVGLVHALNVLHDNVCNPEWLATVASYIEQTKCHQPIGDQDQYAAAYGGFNKIEFTKQGHDVYNIPISTMRTITLQERLFLISTNQTRQAESVLTQQVSNLKHATYINLTKTMVEMAKQAMKMLLYGNLDDFGALLDDSWQVKKQLANEISNPKIDEMYEQAIKAGALGGKILGAGGGGYLLVYVPENKLNTFKNSEICKDLLPFKFTKEGSKVEMKS